MNILFEPHPLLKNGDLQTVAAAWWPTTRSFPENLEKTHAINVSKNNTLIVNSNLQSKNATQCDDILLVHGFEGSSESKYMLRMAKKSLLRGFNVHRMNLRSCGESLYTCNTPYHGGLWEDILHVINRVKTGKRMFVVGYSLGGNLTLKMAGELGESIPDFIKGLSVISAPLDLRSTSDWLSQQELKRYHDKFLSYVIKSYEQRKELYPDVYPNLKSNPQTLREFDEKIMCYIYGFKNLEDYYCTNSCHHVLPKITVPTMVIYAKDDPIIPFQDYDLHLPPKKYNNIKVIAAENGGHVAFIGRKNTQDSDRFWADERIFSYFSYISK